MLIINNLKLELNQDQAELKVKAAKVLRLKADDLLYFKIHKESIDARKEVIFVYSVLVKVAKEKKYYHYKNVSKFIPFTYQIPQVELNKRPIVIGFGPSGIFSSYLLAKANLKPIIFERGEMIEQRSVTVNDFWKKGILNPESNVQFGEGGAGTFSDGKLTTRIKDPRISFILDTLIKFKADEKIAYTHHAHIGTDKLKTIVKNMREEIIRLGGEFHFNTKVDELIVENDTLIGVKAKNDSYYSDHIILAIGHSATDTLKTLNKAKVYLEPKDFAVGVRVEHPQILIDKNQYGSNYNHEKLKASEYHLTYKAQDNRYVYSFCMCPGGYVIPSNSSEKTIVTNGMSYSQRNNDYANAGILVQIKTSDLDPEDIFSGLKYQQNIEQLAYKLANNSYQANCINIKDFINDTQNPLIFKPSYSLGAKLIDYKNLFEPFIINDLKAAFLDFDHKIPGFIDQGIIIGPETRSSSVVKIKRDPESLESVSLKHLYPAGEGAGYSGGIMSSFLDGMKIAETIINQAKSSQ